MWRSCARCVPPLPLLRAEFGACWRHTVRVTKLRVILRCLVTFAIGVLMVVLAIRFGEALWRALTSSS